MMNPIFRLQRIYQRGEVARNQTQASRHYNCSVDALMLHQAGGTAFKEALNLSETLTRGNNLVTFLKAQEGKQQRYLEGEARITAKRYFGEVCDFESKGNVYPICKNSI
ncbi:hypothetical protein FGO68_gene10256 [Halteria grandinella]|uniref:Uncharacterized protein n=1 Tax=Halteria grandinella TaxID=5974 RepID=A0A8J8NR04_HALGN|nr:hypothetical protein FGO68_gene10256 [Halteria grandinella]